MLFLTVLFVIVGVLLAFSLTGDKGKNTPHARRNAKAPSKAVPTGPKKSHCEVYFRQLIRGQSQGVIALVRLGSLS